MRSSSLKVYSPVEYTGYKEKRSGHPSEPGSRTGNRKTTRKPKPILYRLRRFCKRLNWKGIGGLAVTTVVIVFAVRGVVGMFSEHTQTKTAPITTSSPAAEESQPYVFYYKDGQAVSWEDVTDAWAAEAGIQKRYALTDAERLEIAQVLTAEAGGEPFAGKIAVAQCILQTCEDEGIRPDEVLRVYAYSKRRPEPTQEALEAVQDVFDFGIVATTEPIKYFSADWADTEAGGKQMIDDVAAMISMLSKRGLPATECLMAPDVADLFLRNPWILKLLDNRNYNIGGVDPETLPAGASKIARLNIKGRMIDFLTYEDTYTELDGTVKQYIPQGMIAVGAPAAGRTVYGAITQVEQTDGEFHTYTGVNVPKYISDAAHNTRELTLSSAPLPMPNNECPFSVAKVIS